MDPYVEVRNVSKIFGKSPKAAIDLLKQGKSKKEILKENRAVRLGLIMSVLKFILVKFLSLWVYPEAESQP